MNLAAEKADAGQQAHRAVALCWLFDGPRVAAGVHLPKSSLDLAIPKGWTYEGSLSDRFHNLLQIEWVKLGGLSQVECDSKGFFVNVTVTSSRHVCAHAKIEQDEAPER
jgi:hypothetical protein